MELCRILLLLGGISVSSALPSNPVFMDLDEINLVQYDIQIGDSPIVLDNAMQPEAMQVKRHLFLLYLHSL